MRTEIRYFEARLKQTRKLEAASVDTLARICHHELAERYHARIEDLEDDLAARSAVPYGV